MSHSRTTPKLGLPVFELEDKPSWMEDWNAAMFALDYKSEGVITVNGKSGNVIITAQDLGALTEAPVTSVNGKTGAVQIDALEKSGITPKTEDMTQPVGLDSTTGALYTIPGAGLKYHKITIPHPTTEPRTIEIPKNIIFGNLTIKAVEGFNINAFINVNGVQTGSTAISAIFSVDFNGSSFRVTGPGQAPVSASYKAYYSPNTDNVEIVCNEMYKGTIIDGYYVTT